jgi:hypothetical protein
MSLGAVQQVRGEEIARQDRLGLGTQELPPGSACSPRRGMDPGLLQDLPHGRRRYLHSQAGQLTVDPAVPPAGFSRASRRTRALMLRRVAGLPVLPRVDLAAQRRQTMSRCQRTIVSGVTSNRSPRRTFGITESNAASSARSAQSRSGRRGCRRCRMASW